MFTRSKWREYNAMQDALLVNSTKAGQNVINGVTRPKLRAVPATPSNPNGICMVYQPPTRPNPLLTKPRSSSQPLNNALYLKGRRAVPLTATFGDCCKHKEPAKIEG